MKHCGLLVLVALCTTGVQAQDGPSIRGWRTGAALGLGTMGGDYDVPSGLAFGAGVHFVAEERPLGISLLYNFAYHRPNDDDLILHQVTASPRINIPIGSGYVFVGADGVLTLWDFNYAAPQGMFLINHAQAAGVGGGLTAGLGRFVTGSVGVDITASFTLLFFNNPADNEQRIVTGSGRADVLRITIGGWYKPN